MTKSLRVTLLSATIVGTDALRSLFSKCTDHAIASVFFLNVLVKLRHPATLTRAVQLLPLLRIFPINLTFYCVKSVSKQHFKKSRLKSKTDNYLNILKELWCTRQDSNLWPLPSEGSALSSWATSASLVVGGAVHAAIEQNPNGFLLYWLCAPAKG